MLAPSYINSGKTAPPEGEPLKVILHLTQGTQWHKRQLGRWEAEERDAEDGDLLPGQRLRSGRGRQGDTCDLFHAKLPK